MASSVNEFMAMIKAKNPAEPEFHQAVYEVVESTALVIERHPEYVDACILDRMVEPERQIIFRVPWHDDKGRIHVNGKEPTSRAMKLVTARRNAEGRLLKSSHLA